MEVALRARTVLRRIALWGCFGNAITHLLAVMKLRGNWVTIPPPKTFPQYHSTQLRPSLKRNPKMADAPVLF